MPNKNDKKATLERTLILLKPDAVNRGLVGEVISRFEKVGAKMIGMKILVSSKDTAQKHYTEDLAKRRGEIVRRNMIAMLTSGPVVAIALEGIEIVDVTRKLVGATEPKVALPGTIRGDYSHVSIPYSDKKGMGIFNLIHASATPEEAKTEIGIWFKPEELVKHKPHYTNLTLHEDYQK